jgi:hypothetical protein
MSVMKRRMFLVLAVGLALPAAAQNLQTLPREDYEFAARQDARNAWKTYLESGFLGAARNNLAIQVLWRDFIQPALAGGDPGHSALKPSWIAVLFSGWTERYVGGSDLDLTETENWWYAYDKYQSKLFEMKGVDPVSETLRLLPGEVMEAIQAGAPLMDQYGAVDNLAKITEVVTGNFERIALTTEILCRYASPDEPFLDTYSKALFDMVSSGKHLAGEALSALSRLAEKGLVDVQAVDAKIAEYASETSSDPMLRDLARTLQQKPVSSAGPFDRIVASMKNVKNRIVGGSRAIRPRTPADEARDAARDGARDDASRIK